MGNQKVKWTQDEEEALKAGVQKHGVGKWKNILKDPEFAPSLTNRSNIDLKDKWRNMTISIGQTSKDKSKGPKVKSLTIGTQPFDEDDADDDSCKHLQDGKTLPRYSDMIFGAISAINDSNGSDVSAIVAFIEQRLEVPPNFRRLLSSKLRRLVLQGKLEKVENCYKIKDAALGAKTPMLRQKDVWRRPPQNPRVPIEAVQDAAATAAYRIAEAENKSFVVAEAIKEADRVARMADETERVLLLSKHVNDLCSRGEIVLMA